MFARDMWQRRTQVLVGFRTQLLRNLSIVEVVGDDQQVPGAAQVQAVEMHNLRIGAITVES